MAIWWCWLLVSPGAELIADGDIHVYARMRGRALAGARGNVDARIFMQQMAAELVSIAGCIALWKKTCRRRCMSVP